MISIEQLIANKNRMEFDGQITSDNGVWCPHCGQLNAEDDWWGPDRCSLIENIASENVWWDAKLECLHCDKEIVFHVITTRTYYVKIDQAKKEPSNEQDT